MFDTKTTLQDLLDRSAEYDEYKADYLVPTTELSFDNEAKLLVPNDLFNAVTALPLTDWSLSQACHKLGPPNERYMGECPPWLRAENLNHWLDQLSDKKWFVRSYDGRARAILSGVYTPIQNSEVITKTMEMLQDTPHWLIRPYVDPDRLDFKVAAANTEDGNHAIGAYISNGETGNRTFQVSPFVQVHSCTNSIVYSVGGLVQRHAHVSPAFIWAALKEKLGQAFKMSAEMLDRIVEAEAEQIPDLSKVIDTICKDKGLSQPIHELILRGTERQSNRLALAQGLSWAGHQSGDIEMQTRLEAMAGAVLVDRSFQAYYREQ